MAGGELSGVGVLLLALLSERPMHPYDAFQTLEQRRATRLVRVNAGAVYHGFERLERDGLAARVGTDRQGRRPERTTYAITAQGSAALAERVEQLIVDPPPAYPLFTVGVSEIETLSLPTAVAALSSRRSVLESQLESHRQVVAELRDQGVARRHTLEVEYEAAVLAAETAWLDCLVADLVNGAIDWNPDPVQPPAGGPTTPAPA